MTETKNKPFHEGDGAEATDEEESALLDAEVALLAALASRDMGGEPTEDIDLNSLSPTEKQALLSLLQQRLELQGTPTRQKDTPSENPIP